tara:strand:+ start:479 stop:727 length:249 start_codon:yes stop_codon:yes gene_type:complete
MGFGFKEGGDRFLIWFNVTYCFGAGAGFGFGAGAGFGFGAGAGVGFAVGAGVGFGVFIFIIIASRRSILESKRPSLASFSFT